MYNACVKSFNTKIELEALENLGLSQKEALIYLSTLDLGSGTVSEIAANGEIERTGIYYHIDKLLELGLLRTATQGKRTSYLPADPENLKVMLKQKEKDLNKILPKLSEQFTHNTGKSIIEYFQGSEEMSKFYNRVYEIFQSLQPPTNEICIFGTSYRSAISTNKEFLNYSPPKEQIDVHLRTILPKSQKLLGPDGNAGDPYIVTRYNLPRSEIRFIDDKYTYPGSIVITHRHIIFYDRHNLFYSITENPNIAATWRMFFEFIWDRLPNK